MSQRNPAARLYWSVRGEFAWDAHAPDPTDPRWYVEGWQPLRVRAQRGRRTRYECQHCGLASDSTRRLLQFIN
jgi:hypothetical protein